MSSFRDFGTDIHIDRTVVTDRPIYVEGHPGKMKDAIIIGPGTKIWHFCHISKEVEIGSNCVLGQNVYIGPGVRIGSGVRIQNNVSVYSGVTIEDDVFIGPSAVFTNILTPRAFIERKTEFKPTLVKRGATIGANATIICGVTLEEYCLVGAGAVVTHDVKSHYLVMGVPAKYAGLVCKCGERLEFLSSTEIFCRDCKKLFELAEDA